MRAHVRTYTIDFKTEAVALYRRTDRSVRAIASELGVNHWTLRYWIDQDGMKRKRPMPPRPVASKTETLDERLARLERENKELLRENEQLKEDREILKKAAAHSTGQGNSSSKTSAGDAYPRVLRGRSFN